MSAEQIYAAGRKVRRDDKERQRRNLGAGRSHLSLRYAGMIDGKARAMKHMNMTSPHPSTLVHFTNCSQPSACTKPVSPGGESFRKTQQAWSRAARLWLRYRRSNLPRTAPTGSTCIPCIPPWNAWHHRKCLPRISHLNENGRPETSGSILSQCASEECLHRRTELSHRHEHS